MKNKKAMLAMGATVAPFFLIIMILIVAVAGAGSGDEQLNTYQKYKELFIEVQEEIQEEKNFYIKTNELAWYFILCDFEPIYLELKIYANWVADENATYAQMVNYYKENILYSSHIKDYSKEELVEFITNLEDINEDDEEFTVGEGTETGVAIAKKAMTRIGYMYVWGGAHTMEQVKNPNQRSFDCSGLVCWSYYQCGKDIGTATTKELSKMGNKISKKDLSVGDIILFSSDGSYEGIHHVGIYIGDNKMVHAPQTGSPIQIARIDSNYFTKEYYSSRRLY